MVARALRYCGLLAVTMGSGVLLSFTTPPPSKLAAALRGLVRQPQSTVDAQGVESVAITVVVLLAWLSLAWLCVAVILVMGSAAPGPLGALATVVSAVVVPAAARRLLTTVLGVSLLTGVAASAASAAPIPVSPGQSAAATAVATLDLDWPLAPARPAPTAGPRTPPTATAAPARP